MGDTVAIIQARMGSTRLPEKVLLPIGGEPMLWHVCERARCAATIDDVVVATSTEQQDDAVAEFCAERGIDCYRGSEQDVLDRYYQVATSVSADVIVRMTADCPFLSPPVVDRITTMFYRSEAAYVSNTIEYTHPDGLDAEAFTVDTLERVWNATTDPHDREHVTTYLRDSGEFATRNVDNVLDITQYSFVDDETIPRWTVDYFEDMTFVRTVYDRLTSDGHWVFDQHSVFELLEREPALRDINDDR
jgi:spore coat polysaccharide biosynthesis protein SpsF (cytidylyltransferase family)